MDFLVLTQTGGILGPFATALGFIINYIYKGLEFIGIANIGVAIIIFTLIVNLILLPLTIKQQKSSKMMTVMNPELQKIQAKYKGRRDQESMARMQAETSAVYKKYGTSPTGGCLFMIIQLPILFALYQVIYHVPAYVDSINVLYTNIATPLSQVSGGGEIMTGLIQELSLRVTNFDFNNTNTIIDALAALKTADWNILSDAFKSAPDVINAISVNSPAIISANSLFGVLNMADLPLTNGWWPGALIPILSGASQYASMKISMANQPQNNNPDNPMGNSMKTMNMIMPLFSVFICFTFNIGIGIYWIANAIVRTVIMVIANKIIDKKGIDKMIEENKEKARKKAEKRGEDPSKVEEYARMSTRNVDAAYPKKKSIKELANTSTMTAAEKKEENSKKTDDKQNTDSKTIEKNKSGQTSGSISAIAHMLDDKNSKR